MFLLAPLLLCRHLLCFICLFYFSSSVGVGAPLGRSVTAHIQEQTDPTAAPAAAAAPPVGRLGRLLTMCAGQE